MNGEASDLDKQLQILNRTRGLWIEADPRHVREVIKALGLEGASPTSTPGVVAKGETRIEDNEGSIDPEHEESGSIPRWKATGLFEWQAHPTPLLTRIGQETDSQESRSAGA